MEFIMSKKLWFLLGLVLLLLASACDETKGGISEGLRPDIASDRVSVSFGVVAIGSGASQLLILQNVGDADLNISKMTLSGPSAGDFSLALEPDVVYAGERFAISDKVGENTREVLVTFSPTRVGDAEAVLTVYSNDPDESEFKIKLISLQVGPMPQVVPNPIVFPLLKGGEVETIKTTISNVGSAPLQFVDISINGSTDFATSMGERAGIVFPTTPLEPNESFTLDIVYAPLLEGPDLGSLDMKYVFGEETQLHSVEIRATGADPCIRVSPQAIDFGEVIIGQTATTPVTIENCGTQLLSIRGMALSAETADTFGLANLLQVPSEAAPVVLVKDSVVTFDVLFTPVAEEVSLGTLHISSDSLNLPEIDMELFGNGTLNGCPVPVAVGRIQGSTDPWSAELVVAEGDIIDLSGTDSSDPDGNLITGYRWEMLTAPSGFLNGFTPTYAVENPQIMLDLPGNYEVALNVYDEHGRESCAPAMVNIRVKHNNCPIADAAARLAGTTDTYSTMLTVGPADLIDFTAEASSDPDGAGALTYQWSLFSGPAGVSVNWLPNATVEKPQVRIPAGGTFVFELRVFDDRGAESCLPAQVTIFVANYCPTTVAGGRLDGSGGPFTDQVAVAPLQYVELQGSLSTDPDGDALEYRWSVVSAPSGFAQPFSPSAMSANPKIQLTQIGDYIFELVVLDQYGCLSTEPARVAARARSDNQFLMELAWNTNYTDVDFHLLAGAGVWNSAGADDCYYSERNPLWGNLSDVNDDPGLDRDDVDGYGPEQINIKTPQRTDGVGTYAYTVPYEIGVFYYDEHLYSGTTYAVVKIFFAGAVVPDYTLPTSPPPPNAFPGMPLQNSASDFWHVGYVAWGASGGTFTENGQLRAGYP